MLRHTNLYDPVCRTFAMPDEDFEKYVKIRAAHPGGTKPRLVEAIRDKFYSSHPEVSQENLNKVWGFVCPYLSTNAGLAEFVADYDGARSEFFFPWLMSVYQSPARALEMSYGAGYDLNGVWCDWVLNSDDPIVFFVKNDPTFVYNRERQLFVADLVTTIQDRGCHDDAHENGHISKVIDLGAGMLAWARWHGYEFKRWCQTIYAYDKDQSIDLFRLFEEDFSDLGLHYQYGDLLSQLKSPVLKESDLIMLGGVASYMPYEAFVEKVVLPVYDLLNPGGVFFYDLQVNCPYLRRSMNIFEWPAMYLPGSAAEAIASCERIRKSLWSAGVKYSAEYAVDTYNASPSAVMITLEKVV